MSSSERQTWIRHAFYLALLTAFYHTLQFAAGLALYKRTDSPALLTYALDAIVSAPQGVDGVVVELRCTNCGWSHVGAYPPAVVEELDRAMDRAEREIRAALEIYELSDELERIDNFARALHHDLITPEDF